MCLHTTVPKSSPSIGFARHTYLVMDSKQVRTYNEPGSRPQADKARLPRYSSIRLLLQSRQRRLGSMLHSPGRRRHPVRLPLRALRITLSVTGHRLSARMARSHMCVRPAADPVWVRLQVPAAQNSQRTTSTHLVSAITSQAKAPEALRHTTTRRVVLDGLAP